MLVWIIANEINMVYNARTKLFSFLFKFQIACQNIKRVKWLYQIKMWHSQHQCVSCLFYCVQFYFTFISNWTCSRENSNNHNILLAKDSNGQILFVPDKIFTCNCPIKFHIFYGISFATIDSLNTHCTLVMMFSLLNTTRFRNFNCGKEWIQFSVQYENWISNALCVVHPFITKREFRPILTTWNAWNTEDFSGFFHIGTRFLCNRIWHDINWKLNLIFSNFEK